MPRGLSKVSMSSLCLPPAHAWDGAGPVVYWKLDGLLIAFPLLAYGFTSQQFVFGVYQSLRAPTVQRMTSVVKQVPPEHLSGAARATLQPQP